MGLPEKIVIQLKRIILLSFQRIFGDDADPSKVRILFRFMAIALGGLHTYAAVKSQSMNADGIAYLDIGDAYFRADWANAINAVWSPLYSWILGLVNFIFKPSMEWEFPTVHIVNFIIYLFALTSFEFMWSKVRKKNSQPESHRLSDPLWWTLGYLLFIWTSLSLIQIWSVTPDMLMAAFVFLAAGLVARIRSGNDGQRLFLSLGLILGLGYLSKTFMFSVALVFLGLVWLVQKRTWSSFTKTLLATGMFLIVSLPFILLISNLKGKFTIGEAGTVTYLRHVAGIPYPHWQGDPLNDIVPAHPSRVVHQSPPVYEFGEPIGGTYPISIDPSYWYEGINVPINSKALLVPLYTSGLYYLDLFFQKQGILVACVLALYFMGYKTKQTRFEILNRWALVIPAVIAFGLYGLVLVASRYIGVFVLLFWADILANIRLPDTGHNRSWLKALSGIAAIGLLANIVMFNLDGFNRLNPSLEADPVVPAASPARPLAVAQALQDLDVRPGDKVGVIGYAYDSSWARLARVRIVAEMLEADAMELWRGDEALQQEVLQSFASTGVRAVVAEYVPAYARLNDWHQVGNSNYFIYRFRE
jgi:4-amino-4-deoxy-L-arabinose transferase-like glycosyltransferase